MCLYEHYTDIVIKVSVIHSRCHCWLITVSSQTIYFPRKLMGKRRARQGPVCMSVFISLNFICHFNPQVQSPIKFFCSSAQVTPSLLPSATWFCQQTLLPFYSPSSSKKSFLGLWQSIVMHICTAMQERERSYGGERWNSHRFELFALAFIWI